MWPQHLSIGLLVVGGMILLSVGNQRPTLLAHQVLYSNIICLRRRGFSTERRSSWIADTRNECAAQLSRSTKQCSICPRSIFWACNVKCFAYSGLDSGFLSFPDTYQDMLAKKNPIQFVHGHHGEDDDESPTAIFSVNLEHNRHLFSTAIASTHPGQIHLFVRHVHGRDMGPIGGGMSSSSNSRSRSSSRWCRHWL
jgi:hypothetical protein